MLNNASTISPPTKRQSPAPRSSSDSQADSSRVPDPPLLVRDSRNARRVNKFPRAASRAGGSARERAKGTAAASPRRLGGAARRLAPQTVSHLAPFSSVAPAWRQRDSETRGRVDRAEGRARIKQIDLRKRPRWQRTAGKLRFPITTRLKSRPTLQFPGFSPSFRSLLPRRPLRRRAAAPRALCLPSSPVRI